MQRILKLFQDYFCAYFLRIFLQVKNQIFAYVFPSCFSKFFWKIPLSPSEKPSISKFRPTFLQGIFFPKNIHKSKTRFSPTFSLVIFQTFQKISENFFLSPVPKISGPKNYFSPPTYNFPRFFRIFFPSPLHFQLRFPRRFTTLPAPFWCLRSFILLYLISFFLFLLGYLLLRHVGSTLRATGLKKTFCFQSACPK